MLNIINRISSRAKFPLSYVRGSEKQRFIKAKELTQSVYDYMQHSSGESSWSFEKLKQAIDKTVSPHKINIIISAENSKKYLGSLQDIVSTKTSRDFIKDYSKISVQEFVKIYKKYFLLVSLDGYKLKIRTDKNNKIVDKYIVLHELRHLFDSLCNPKIAVIRRNTMAQITTEQKKAYDIIHDLIFDDFFSGKDFKSIKNEIIKNIEIIPENKRTNVLQGLRNHLKSEINAYNQEFYQRCKNPLSQFSYIINSYYFINYQANFDKKLKLLNNLLKKCLEQERAKSVKI